MSSRKLKLSLFFPLLLIFILGANFIPAPEQSSVRNYPGLNFVLVRDVSAKELEIQYPPVPFPGVETPQEFLPRIEREKTPEAILGLYVKYFYHLFLTISGLLVLGAMTYGGICYLISAGSPVKMKSAREWISGGILGLIILLSTYLILYTINPELVILKGGRLTSIESSQGIKFYQETEYGGKLKVITNSVADNLEGIVGFPPKSLKFFSPAGQKDKNWEWPDEKEAKEGELKIIFYEMPNFNKGYPEGKQKEFSKNAKELNLDFAPKSFRFITKVPEKEQGLTYWELPTGEQIEKALGRFEKKDEAWTQLKTRAENIERLSKEIKEKSIVLQNKTNECRCVVVCDDEGNCQCTGGCPAEVYTLLSEVLTKNQQLLQEKRAFEETNARLETEDYQLKVTKGLMIAAAYHYAPLLSAINFINLKEELPEEVKVENPLASLQPMPPGPPGPPLQGIPDEIKNCLGGNTTPHILNEGEINCIRGTRLTSLSVTGDGQQCPYDFGYGHCWYPDYYPEELRGCNHAYGLRGNGWTIVYISSYGDDPAGPGFCGTRTEHNKTTAADITLFPCGTILNVPGYNQETVVNDTGCFGGEWLDLYSSTPQGGWRLIGVVSQP